MKPKTSLSTAHSSIRLEKFKIEVRNTSTGIKRGRHEKVLISSHDIGSRHDSTTNLTNKRWVNPLIWTEKDSSLWKEDSFAKRFRVVIATQTRQAPREWTETKEAVIWDSEIKIGRRKRKGICRNMIIRPDPIRFNRSGLFAHGTTGLINYNVSQTKFRVN